MNRWTRDDRFQRCRACGATWDEREFPDLHVRRGAVPSLETLCHGPYDLVEQSHDGETGAERERVVSLAPVPHGEVRRSLLVSSWASAYRPPRPT